MSKSTIKTQIINYDIFIELIESYLISNKLYRFSTDKFHYIFDETSVYICKVNNKPNNDIFYSIIGSDTIIEFLDKHENFTQDDIDILCLNLL